MRITLALLFAAACVTARQVMVDLTENETPNALYFAEPGDQVTLKLNENPSTGFSWVLINRDNSNRIQNLDLVKQEYIPNNRQHDEVYGAGGIKYYHFNALQEGDEPLELIYCQVWSLKPLVDEQSGKVNWEQAAEHGIDLSHITVEVRVKAGSANEDHDQFLA